MAVIFYQERIPFLLSWIVEITSKSIMGKHLSKIHQLCGEKECQGSILSFVGCWDSIACSKKVAPKWVEKQINLGGHSHIYIFFSLSLFCPINSSTSWERDASPRVDKISKNYIFRLNHLSGLPWTLEWRDREKEVISSWSSAFRTHDFIILVIFSSSPMSHTQECLLFLGKHWSLLRTFISSSSNKWKETKV